MPKVTYRAQTPDDPVFTRVGGVAFEHGNAVEVSDAMAAALKGNPWFTGGSGARDDAVSRVAAQGLGPGPDSGIDSSVMPANAPGQGMKHDPDTVMTADGMKPAADADMDETVGGLRDQAQGPRRLRHPAGGRARRLRPLEGRRRSLGRGAFGLIG